MSDYRDLVKKEAKEFFEEAWPQYSEDSEEFGARSEAPNFLRWIDRAGTLSERLQKICEKWGHKEIHWVQVNTRNPNPHGGGDPRSNAFASFLQDVRHELKKLAKARRGAS